ncbi:hypothetical protein [Jannaschia helgolandensis]|uniref:hypothetical protein n=1 Tax=Jannaschia helgolandensis TaxID=188906 RepID=UPI0030D7C99B|tara:strand:- start:2557 stop:3474 length:918 start_codon:yes stop_codon:yes gene_type:complete
MTFKYDADKIKQTIQQHSLSKLLPLFEYRGSDLNQYLTIIGTPDKTDPTCYTRLEVKFDANYTTIASDTGAIQAVLGLMTKIIDLTDNKSELAPGVIVNAIKDGVEALKDIIEREEVNGTKVKMSFPVTSCGEQAQPIVATLFVRAAGRVSNADDDEGTYNPHAHGAARARLDTALQIGTDPREADWIVSARDAESGNERTYALQNATLLRGTQIVTADILPQCRTTDNVTIFDEVAGLTIYWIKLVIEAIPPERYWATFSDKFLDRMREEGITVPAPRTPAEKKMAQKIEAKKNAPAETPPETE